jgi:hypothetical protein
MSKDDPEPYYRDGRMHFWYEEDYDPDGCGFGFDFDVDVFEDEDDFEDID